MSNIFIYANGQARELSLVEWLDLWAALPPEIAAAIEAGAIIALGNGAQVWKRS